MNCRRFSLFLFGALAAISPVPGADAPAAATATTSAASASVSAPAASTPSMSAPSGAPAAPIIARTLTNKDAAILGVVEGVTEYLPVSSIGHTILAARALGLDAQSPLRDVNGNPIMLQNGHGEKAAAWTDADGTVHQLLIPDDPRIPPGAGFLTLKDAMDVYNVMVQAGPIAAIIVLFWRRVWSVLRGVFGRDPQGLLVLRNLLIAFVPAAALGFLGNKWIHAHLFSYQIVAIGLSVGAVVIIAAEQWRQRNQREGEPGPELHELTCKQALLIGACQCLSLWPGMSRSMMTMVGGYLAGLRPARAAEFSFLLGLLTLTAASGYEAHGHLADIRQGFATGPMLLGIGVATVAALVTVKLFVGWLGRHGLVVFAWYRFALAATVLWVMRG